MRVKDFIGATASLGLVSALYSFPLLAFVTEPSPPVTVTEVLPQPEREVIFMRSEENETSKSMPSHSKFETSKSPGQHSKFEESDDSEPVASLEPSEPITDDVSLPPLKIEFKTKRRGKDRYKNCKDNKGITKTKQGYTVQREVLDYYASILTYEELGLAFWHKNSNGERDGIRVRKISCDLREAGIRNGDIIHSANGKGIKSIPQAIALWWKTRRSRRVELKITRKGKPLTINYRLTK